jgi:serine/threonine protein kinase/tetratricopeptide (TPR) repeat protein
MTPDKLDPSTLCRSLDEAARRQFEQDWREGRPNPIERYLPPPDSSLYLPTLEELVLIELELRWKARGETADPSTLGPLVEGYLERFPLLNQPETLRRLVNQEQRVRRRQGDHFAPEEYQARFPDLTQADNSRETEVGRRAAVPEELPRVPGYEVLGLLGRGGMGVVYKARQVHLNRLVAIKMIRAGVEAEDGELTRFRREAEAVARLQHPNVVQIYEVSALDHRPYFSMELVEGGSLGDLLAGKAWPPRQAARLIELLARAVHHAHQHGIVHRDLKPANILLQPLAGDGSIERQRPADSSAPSGLAPGVDGPAPGLEEYRPKISDFGLAKCLDTDGSLTQTGALVGTPTYMAPEQAAGQSTAIGPAADVYSLGVLLYEAITGQPPFRGATVLETLEQVRSREPVPPRRLQSAVPRDLETICLKALAKDPARRYPSALALAQDLELFRAGEPIRARPEGLASRLWRKARRRPLALVSVLVLLVAGVVAGAIGLAAQRDRQIAVLIQEIESGLQKPELRESYLTRMEARIADLNDLLPEKAAAARGRLYERFAESIREKFGERLTAAEAKPLQTAIGWLSSRDANLAVALGKECARHLAGWEPLFQLQPPFANFPEVFLGATDRFHSGAGGVLLRRSGKGGDFYVFTQRAWAGNIKLRAVFERTWANAAQLGVVLGPDRGQGYSCLLTVPESFRLLGEPTPLQPLPATFADARKTGKSVVMVLIRHEVGRLVQKELRASELFTDAPGDGTLRLEVKRAGARLTFEINGRHAITFSEIYPIHLEDPVRFGLYWPQGVGLRSLHGERLLSPAQPSPLEKGDDLYNRGEYEAARAWYQQTARRTRTELVRQEALYKEGMCLRALNRPDEAFELFQKLAAEPDTGDKGRPWPALADCQLLMAYHRQNTPEARAAAGALLDRLIVRPGLRPGEFASAIPLEERDSILKGRTLNAVRAIRLGADEVLADCERVNKIAALFGEDEYSRLALRLDLVKTYHLVGREAEAVRASYELQRHFEDFCRNNGLWGTWVLDQHSWLLRRQTPGPEGARRARQELDRWLFTTPGVLRRDGVGTVYFPLVERARLHAALKEWGQAEADLDEFFRVQAQESRRQYGFHAGACLLQGFLRERRGDHEGARAAWRRGLIKSWEKENPADPSPAELTERAGIALVSHIIMASFTGELGDDEAARLLDRLWSTGQPGQTASEMNALSLMARSLKPPPAALREMWRTPRGKEWARRIALRELSYDEYIRTPLVLFAAELLRQRALPAPVSSEQDELVWTLCRDMDTAYRKGILKDSDLISLGAAWKGINLGGLGWKSLEAKVLKSQPQLRGPLAYLLGHRSLQKKRQAEARTYFTTAHEAQPENAVLRRLAQAELDRLKAK